MDFLLIALAKLWPWLAGLATLLVAYLRIRSTAYDRGKRDAELATLNAEREARTANDLLIEAARRARARAESLDHDELHDPHSRP